MNDQTLWGAILIATIATVGGSQLYRYSNDENFELNRFDYIGTGVLVFFIVAAVNQWHIIPSVVVALGSALTLFALTKIRWRGLLGRANTRFKRIALLAFPFFAIVAIYLWNRYVDHGDSALSFMLFTMASVLCLLIAFTSLDAWLRGPGN